MLPAEVLDDARFWAAVITGGAGLAAAIFAIINGGFKFLLELRRTKHEEIRWILELQSELEKRLHDGRFRTYPQVFEWLLKLSHHPTEILETAKFASLATELNEIGYSEAALYMLPETRKMLFRLRGELSALADGGENVPQRIEEMRAKTRTKLTEMLRRDLNHARSEWGDYRPLLDQIVLSIATAKKRVHGVEGTESQREST